MRKPLISGNWKMNLNHFEAIQTVQKLAYLVAKDDLATAEVSIHPPFTDIRSVQTVLDSDKIGFALGAQHCHFDDKGAFTGEVSAVFLSKLNVRYVIVGHSERRELFHETDDAVRAKVGAVLKQGMTPIICVGETLAEREAGTTMDKVTGQVRSALQGCSPAQVATLVIAYEPIWAIGTGKTATSSDAQEVCSAIRRTVAGVSGDDAAAATRSVRQSARRRDRQCAGHQPSEHGRANGPLCDHLSRRRRQRCRAASRRQHRRLGLQRPQ